MAEYITKERALQIAKTAVYLSSPDEAIKKFAYNFLEAHIRAEPAANVAPVVRGKWEDLLYTDEQGNHYYWCTKCHAVLRTLNCNHIEWFSFCPSCGAKMKIPDNIDPAKAFSERTIDDFEKWNKHIPQEVLDKIRKVVNENG